MQLLFWLALLARVAAGLVFGWGPLARARHQPVDHSLEACRPEEISALRRWKNLRVAVLVLALPAVAVAITLATMRPEPWLADAWWALLVGLVAADSLVAVLARCPKCGYGYYLATLRFRPPVCVRCQASFEGAWLGNQDLEHRRSFADEFALSLRAGRGEITDEERRALVREGHPILVQAKDPDTLRLLQLFARLPDRLHRQLLGGTSLKWRFTALDEERRQVCRAIVGRLVDQAVEHLGQPLPGFSVEALDGAYVGFAVVDVLPLSQRVVSWYVLWTEISDPTWVTVVNPRAAGTHAYFQAHFHHLMQLRAREESESCEE